MTLEQSVDLVERMMVSLKCCGFSAEELARAQRALDREFGLIMVWPSKWPLFKVQPRKFPDDEEQC